jgi:hypothetical protein
MAKDPDGLLRIVSQGLMFMTTASITNGLSAGIARRDRPYSVRPATKPEAQAQARL